MTCYLRKISDDTIDYLVNAPWKGNIRELKNLLERVMILIEDDKLSFKNIRAALTPYVRNSKGTLQNTFFNIQLNPQKGHNLIHEGQKQLLMQALKYCKQNRTTAARLLGIPRTTLNFYLKKFHLTD